MADLSDIEKAAASFHQALGNRWFRWFLALLCAFEALTQRLRWLGLLENKRTQWLAKRHPNDKWLASSAEELRLLALFDPLAPWEKNKLWLDGIERDIRKMRLVSEVVMAYIHNQRLADARLAARYWLQIPLDWARQHPSEARRALKLRHQLWDWYGPRRFINWAVVFLDDKRALKAIMEVQELDNQRWIGARDATAALGFIDFLESQAALDNSPLPKKSSNIERSPWTTLLKKCDETFAERIGMPSETFDDIWRHAVYSKFTTETFEPKSKGV